MKVYVYMLMVLCSFSLQAQELKVVFTGSVTNQSKFPIKGSMVYLIQNQQTLDASIVGSKGGFVISSVVQKSSPFVIQVSNPGYVSQRFQFNLNGLNIPRNSLGFSIKPVDTLSVMLVPVNPLITINVSDKDFADIYQWDDKSKHCIPNFSHRKKYADSLNQRIQDEEGRQLIQWYKGKSSTFEQVKNYQLAIQYLDSAAKKATSYKLQDTTIDRKKQTLQAAQTAQLKEIAKKREIDSLFVIGDSLLAVLKLKDAESIYKLIQKKDPTAKKAATKLDVVLGLKKEEELRQKQLSSYKSNRTACYNAVKVKKYTEAIKSIQKNLTLTLLPKSYFDSIPKTVDSLNVLLKEENLQKELTIEINKFKAVKSKIELGGMKASLDKIQGICSNFKDTSKVKTVNSELDKLIRVRVDEDIPNAYKLHSNGRTEYDKAIGEYEKIKGFIALISDSVAKKQRLSEADIKIADARKNKEDANQKRQLALTTFNNYLDSLTFNPQFSPGYAARLAKLKSMILAPPFKTGIKEKPMEDMISRYKKLEKYFIDNKKSIPLMNQKDSVKALAVANELLIKAGANDLGKLELAFLSAKVDSIKLKVSPSKQLASNTVRGSKILPPTGATLVNGNIQDAFDDLSFTSKRDEFLTKQAWEQLKESVNTKNFRDGQINELSSDAQRKFIETQESTRASISQEEASQSKSRELQNIATVDATLKSIDKRNIENLALTNQLADESVKTKDVIDRVNFNQGIENEAARHNTRDFIDSMNSRREEIGVDESLRNKDLESDQRKFLNSNEVARVNQEYIVDRQHKSDQRAQEKIANYVDTRTYSPNYLKDTSGNCLKWNQMTEFIYQFKNELGFTTSILVRRVVVNKDGYGVIYEKITSDSGKCAYSLNGQPIPEAVWIHDSTGESTFTQDGPIDPVGCQ
ncbi:MAG: hypothetical protein K9I25_00455 [Crocinitomicaceae bacterium]|nr:hypothetical protein [Crocinitomicaceae bacterium]